MPLLENHAAAVALNYFAHNFIKIHRTLRMSPAMAAGVRDRLWSVGLGYPLGSIRTADGGKSGMNMTHFEYKFELNIGENSPNASMTEIEPALNKLGKDGWELVAVSPCGRDNAYTGYWFKRPLSK